MDLTADGLVTLVQLAVRNGTADALPAVVRQWADGATAEVARLLEENERTKMNAEMSDGCLDMIRDALAKLGCGCPPEVHAATPPMCYDDWVRCVARNRDQRIKTLEAENERLRKELQQAKAQVDVLKRGGV